MKERINSNIKSYLIRSTSYVLLLGVAVCVIPLALAQRNTTKTRRRGRAFPASIIVVTNTNDSGPGSLRDALAAANDGDEITFAITGIITLTSGELLVDRSIPISGPGADTLAVNGNAMSRVFHIGSGTIVNISGLTITNGNANGVSYPDFAGGGIYNDHASLTVNDCRISDNSAF